MNKIKKLLGFLLVLIMVVSLFVGCGPATQDPNQTSDPDKNVNGSSSVENDMFPLEEPVTFKMGVRGEKDYQTLMEKCEWYKYLCEKTNVFIECVALGSSASSKLGTLITTGAAPDVVLGPITLSSNEIVDLASQGHIIALDDYVEDASILPNYQRLLASYPTALSKMTAPDGHIWSLASFTTSPGSSWESPLTVNIEWLKQVPGYADGKTFPKTVEEFTDVLRYFKEHDMNGNGDPTDEIPFLFVSSSQAPADSQATLQGLMHLWGIGTKDSNNDYYVHIDDNDVVTIAPTTENYRDCLEWVNIWYKEGLLWENFFSKVTNAEFSNVHGNEVAKWGFFNGSAWHYNGDQPNRNQPWRDAQTLVVPFDTGYDPHCFINPAATGNLNSFTIFSTCEHPEILLAWYDQFLSVEGSLSVMYGMINEWERYEDAEAYRAYYEAYPTWSKDENGKYTFPQLALDYQDLKQFNADLNDKKLEDHPTWNATFNLNAVCKGLTTEEFLNGSWPDHEASETRVLGQWIEDHPEYFDYNVWPRPYATAEEAEELTLLWPSVQRVISDWEVFFIKGTKSLDTDWDDFQAELEDAGSEQLIEILQGMWDRVK